MSSDSSTDGINNFAARFGRRWDHFIFHSCIGRDNTVSCDHHGNTNGNTIFDGGSDMYDIGNVIVTSLMDQISDVPGVAGCGLGAIMYLLRRMCTCIPYRYTTKATICT